MALERCNIYIYISIHNASVCDLVAFEALKMPRREANENWGIACQNVQYLAVICDVELLELPRGAGVRFGKLRSYNATILRLHLEGH